MGNPKLEQMLKDYLEDSHPRQYRQMKKAGELRQFIKAGVEQADKLQASLAASEMRDYEAREMVIESLC